MQKMLREQELLLPVVALHGLISGAVVSFDMRPLVDGSEVHRTTLNLHSIGESQLLFGRTPWHQVGHYQLGGHGTSLRQGMYTKAWCIDIKGFLLETKSILPKMGALVF